MPHRALSILDSVTALLEAGGYFGGRIYKARVRSVGEADGEVPCALVYALDDVPLSPSGNDSFGLIDSALTLSVITVAQASDEASLVDELIEQRRQVHLALMADQLLGLPFVSGTRYAGALTPTIDDSGSRLVGRLESRWTVIYCMNLADPA